MAEVKVTRNTIAYRKENGSVWVRVDAPGIGSLAVNLSQPDFNTEGADKRQSSDEFTQRVLGAWFEAQQTGEPSGNGQKKHT